LVELCASPWFGRLLAMRAVRLGAVVLVSLGVGAAAWWQLAAVESSAQALADRLDETTHIQSNLNTSTNTATTDRGNPIELLSLTGPEHPEQLLEYQKQLTADFDLSFIRRQPVSALTNCHGWVFAGGEYWIRGRSVPQILDDNGYRFTTYPRRGDLVIYRDGVDSVSHSGIVRYVSRGEPTLVESKWGAAGVYLHPVDKTPYGKSFAYYHSRRSGHKLTITSTEPVKN
jgi:hypothetical protein